ncbi:S9 family peptidase [Ilumatobacter sp.]|uniref:S9 family peptidase n=1 Tax=Ilumatobacter sp. TaxID=1967498 RepID=UPI003AF8CB6F
MPAAEPDSSAHAEIARDLIHLRSAVGSPTVSLDGTHVATVVSTVDLDENTTRSCIWLDESPLTAGPTDSQPAWSPDGARLAFVSRRDTDTKKTTLHVMPVDGPGELRTLCTMDDGIGDLAWSPDGRHLAFTSRTRDDRYDAEDVRWQSPRKIERFLSRLNGQNWIFDRPQHVYVVAADGTGTPRNLTPGTHEYGSVAWTPDSDAIVTSGRAHDTWEEDLAEDLYLVPLDGEARALTRHTGLFSAPAVSPDGASVACIGMDNALEYPQNMKIGLVPIEGGEHRWISSGLDRTFFAMTCAQAPVWESDDTLLAAAEDRGETHLYRLGVDGRDPEQLTSGALSVQGYDVKQGVLATTRSTVRHGGELWLTVDGDDRRVTHVTSDLRGWERFSVPCSDGSAEIDAWIMRPDDFDESASYPVLLNVHGGPFTQYGEYFFDEAQMQAAAGFVVLMSNPRGGSGRDTAWGQAIIGPKHPTAPGLGWGTVDVDDVMAVLDNALDRYTFCDRSRVGMLGGSYGGFMATVLAARYGDRFRGICSERSVNNMLTEEWSSDIATFFRSEHGPNPVEDPDEYLRMSPITMADDIHVPMLLIHAEEDFRCPINQAEELWVTLRLLKRDVTFYRFPGENHDLSRTGSPVHRRMRAEIILDWFAERLAAD